MDRNLNLSICETEAKILLRGLEKLTSFPGDEVHYWDNLKDELKTFINGEDDEMV